jgi:GDP-L-fucose synthase
MRKLLVTGGNGLVGSAIEADIKIGREFDLTNTAQTQKAFELHKPTHVIHCAGKVGGLGGNMNYKGEYLYDNLMINTNVIEEARKAGVTNLVAFLSTCVFPDSIDYPLTEKKIHLGEPHSSNYPYAYSKRMSDIQIRAYREQYGVKYTSVIPCNIYGPNDNFSLDHGHVIPMLMHKIYQAQQNKSELVIWGDGSPLREFMYSKDVARLAEWAVDNYDEVEPIIFSTSEEISIAAVVELLVDAFNFKGAVRFDKSKPNGQHRKPSDNSKLKTYLPDFKFTPIEEGLTQTVKWFIDNYETSRK